MMDNKARTLTGQEKAQQLYDKIKELYEHCESIKIEASSGRIRIETDTRYAIKPLKERDRHAN